MEIRDPVSGRIRAPGDRGVVLGQEEETGLQELVRLQAAELDRVKEQLNSEIAQRAYMARELVRSNRALKVLSECNQALVRAKKETQLFEHICDIVVSVGGYHAAAVLFSEHDEGKTVNPVAQIGFGPGYLESLRISWGDNERGQGSMGRAIRTGEPVVMRNILDDPSYKPWRSQALGHGYGSIAAFPLGVDGGVIGVLSITAEEADAFDDGEVDILAELAEDMAYGIISIRTTARHESAVKALEESEKKFRLLFEKSADAIVLSDGGRIVDCNEAAVRLMGCAGKDPMIGLSASDMSPERQPDGRPSSDKAKEMIDIALKEGSNRFEWLRRSFDGQEFWMDISLTAIPFQGKQILYSVWRDIQDRKTSEARLRASEEKLRIAFDQTFQFTGLLRPDGVLVAANKTALQAIGVAEADVTGRFFPDTSWWTHSKSEQDKLKEAIEKARSGEVVRFETSHRTANGVIRYFDFSLRPVKDFENNVIYLNAEGRDVTRLREAEEALRASERKYRSIFDYSVLGVFQSTPEGRFITVNPAFAQMTGFASPEEMMEFVTDIPNQLYASPGDREEFKSAFGNHGLVRQFETLFRRKDGSLFWVLMNVRAIRGDDGRVLYYEGSAEDVTDRKRAKDALKESEERYRTAIESSNDGVAIIKGDEHLYVNRKFVEIFGYDSVEELAGKPQSITVHPDDFPMVARYNEKRQKGEAVPSRYEFKGIRKDGAPVHVEVSATRTTHLGEPVSLAYLRDVTERKILESRLRQSQKMEAVGALAGGIAHDFNNILTVITGYGALLRMGMEKQGQMRIYVDQILEASQKAADLTKGLLTFSRQQAIELSPLDINDIVRGTEKLLKRLLTEDISLKARLAPRKIMVMADATQIDQILFNLAANARDAMKKGGTLIIETKVVELDGPFVKAHGFGEPGRYAVLSFSDTGAGMDSLTKEKIFEPFFTTKESGKGTGLGLATVYGIVKTHNGYINVYSEPGIGTTFRIYIPEAEALQKGMREAPPPPRGGKETILIAEDHSEVRGLMKEVLCSRGYTVIEATDGEDAVKRFKEHGGIDLLVFDSVMPRKSGREAYEAIRKTDPRVRVIFTSGYTKDIILDKGIQDGEFDFIKKPIGPNEMLEKVREVLDRKDSP